eukprot:6482428-Amphidinium_carterae.1
MASPFRDSQQSKVQLEPLGIYAGALLAVLITSTECAAFFRNPFTVLLGCFRSLSLRHTNDVSSLTAAYNDLRLALPVLASADAETADAFLSSVEMMMKRMFRDLRKSFVIVCWLDMNLANRAAVVAFQLIDVRTCTLGDTKTRNVCWLQSGSFRNAFVQNDLRGAGPLKQPSFLVRLEESLHVPDDLKPCLLLAWLTDQWDSENPRIPSCEFVNSRQSAFVVAAKVSTQIIRYIYFFVLSVPGVVAMSLEAQLQDSLPPVFLGANFVSERLLIGSPRPFVSFSGHVCASHSAGHSANPATT